MVGKKKFWAASYNGKQIHIEYNKRISRKLKKTVKVIFDALGDEYKGYVVVSPNYLQALKAYEDIYKSLSAATNG
jgi:hypothetical protein